MKKFALFFSLLIFSAVSAQANDVSLIDLFGEAPKKEESKPAPKKETKPAAKTSEEKTKVDEEGVFSFLNFSFLRSRSKETPGELTRGRDEPQESFVERMTRLAEEGDLEAALTLGYMFLYGENGVEPDAQKAFKYYSMAASMDDKVAINNLGSLYFSGIGTEKNVLRAVQMFEKAAKLGNNEAAVNLAFIYLTTPNINTVKHRIIELFSQAAEGGNVTAQYMLGYSYYRGFGVNKDDKRAFELINLAAKSFDEAQYHLARMYMNAEGTPRNYGNAVRNLAAAANQGNIEAMLTLGNILAAGVSYPKNEYEAYIWFNIASVHNARGAAEKRDILENILKIDEVLQAQTAAENFREKPTEITNYIRQTFGHNIGGFIDSSMNRPANRRK